MPTMILAAGQLQSRKLFANIGYSAQIECERKHIICEWRKSVAGSAADEVSVLALKHLSWISSMTSATSGCFCREINLLDGSFDNGVHFARESALAPIRALLPRNTERRSARS